MSSRSDDPRKPKKARTRLADAWRSCFVFAPMGPQLHALDAQALLLLDACDEGEPEPEDEGGSNGRR